MTLPARLTLLLACLLVAACSVAARPGKSGPLVLPPETGRLDVSPWVDMLSTAGDGNDDSLQSQTIPNLDDAMPWRRQSGPMLMGASQRIYWLRLRVRNPGPAQTLNLEMHRATLEHLTLFSRDAQGHWTRLNDGTLSLHHRPGPVGFLFPLHLPHGDSVHYLRMTSTFPLFTNLTLSTPLETLRYAQSSAGWFGVFLGVLATLGLLPLLRAPRRVTLEKLAQAGLYLSIVLYALCDRGALGNWWLSIPGAQHAFEQLGVMFINVSTTTFVMAMLNVRQQLSRRRLGILLALLLLQSANLMQGIVAPTYFSNLCLLGVSLLTSVTLTALCWRAWRRQRHADARLITWAILMLVARCAVFAYWPGWMPFFVEPYQLLLAWALLTAPLTRSLAHRHISIRHGVTESRSAPTLAADNPAMPRVLVVEDNHWVQQVLTGFLGRLGCRGHSVSDGESALAWLRSQDEPPDLILMDCDLPGMDGLTTTRRWRQEEYDRHRTATPVIGITAYVTSFQHSRMLEAGMNECLDKPVSMSRLADVLDRWLPPRAQGST